MKRTIVANQKPMPTAHSGASKRPAPFPHPATTPQEIANRLNMQKYRPAISIQIREYRASRVRRKSRHSRPSALTSALRSGEPGNMREARVARISFGVSACEECGRVCSMNFSDERSGFVFLYFTTTTRVWSINSSPKARIPQRRRFTQPRTASRDS